MDAGHRFKPTALDQVSEDEGATGRTVGGVEFAAEAGGFGGEDELAV